MFTTSLVTIALLLTMTVPEQPNAILGVKHEVILERLGLTSREPIFYSEDGVDLLLDSAEMQIQRLRIGVFPSLRLANDSVDRSIGMTSIGPIVVDSDSPLGDYLAWWPNWARVPTASPAEATRVLFRRTNCVVDISIHNPSPASFQMLLKIDDWLQHDPSVAPKANFYVTPEIAEIWVPTEMSPAESYTFVRDGQLLWWPQPRRERLEVTFCGIANTDALRVRIADARHGWVPMNEVTLDGRSLTEIDFVADGELRRRPRRPDEDGRFMLKVPERVGIHHFRMIAISPDNLVLSREFPVFVIDNSATAAIK